MAVWAATEQGDVIALDWELHTLVGASLSEPHTSVTSLRCVTLTKTETAAQSRGPTTMAGDVGARLLQLQTLT